MKNQLIAPSTATMRTVYKTTYKDGTGYSVTATPAGYEIGGVTFATLAAALKAARESRTDRR